MTCNTSNKFQFNHIKFNNLHNNNNLQISNKDYKVNLNNYNYNKTNKIKFIILIE